MVWNFGMGRPQFTTERPDSQVVHSYNQNEYNDWQNDYNQRLQAAQSAVSGPEREYLPEWFLRSAYGGDGPNPTSLTPTWGEWPGTFGQDAGGVYYERSPGVGFDSAAFQGEANRVNNDFTQAAERRARQQQAYQQQLGSGFTGGIINDSYSNPFAGQITGTATGGAGGDPAMPGVTMPWAQPWGTPGFGGATGGASIGGYSPSGMGQPTQQQNGGGGGWGGPFGKANPWSLG